MDNWRDMSEKIASMRLYYAAFGVLVFAALILFALSQSEAVNPGPFILLSLVALLLGKLHLLMDSDSYLTWDRQIREFIRTFRATSSLIAIFVISKCTLLLVVLSVSEIAGGLGDIVELYMTKEFWLLAAVLVAEASTFAAITLYIWKLEHKSFLREKHLYIIASGLGCALSATMLILSWIALKGNLHWTLIAMTFTILLLSISISLPAIPETMRFLRRKTNGIFYALEFSIALYAAVLYITLVSVDAYLIDFMPRILYS